MKRLLLLLMCIFAAFSAVFAAKMLPQDGRELVDVKYAGWSGVLRVNVCAGWQPGSGSFLPWLNRCAASFEKEHNGVYVQIAAVEAGELTGQAGLRPPDGVLFAPGLLESADGLIPLPAELPLRDGVRTSYYAAPVALGGYCWALADGENPATLLPADDDVHSYSAALLALSAGGEPIDTIEPPGIDLGLEAFAPVSPGVIMETDAPLSIFLKGEAGAMVATQREIARLEAYGQQGRGPDWTVDARSSITFTDQLLAYAIPECTDEDADARRALSLEFLNHLLSDACQSALTSAGAFPATDAPAAYPPADPLASMDIALRDPNLITPPVFTDAWRPDARLAYGEYASGEYTAEAAFRRLFGVS